MLININYNDKDNSKGSEDDSIWGDENSTNDDGELKDAVDTDEEL